MLEAKTEEQKARIEGILGDTSIWTDDGVVDGLHIDDWVSFDRLAELIDYLRSINKQKKKKKNSPHILESRSTRQIPTNFEYCKNKDYDEKRSYI